jgi:hypothetical protein
MSEIWTEGSRVGYRPLWKPFITSNVSLLTRFATSPTFGMTAPRRSGTSPSHWVRTFRYTWRFSRLGVQVYRSDLQQFTMLLNERPQNPLSHDEKLLVRAAMDRTLVQENQDKVTIVTPCGSLINKNIHARSWNNSGKHLHSRLLVHLRTVEFSSTYWRS